MHWMYFLVGVARIIWKQRFGRNYKCEIHIDIMHLMTPYFDKHERYHQHIPISATIYKYRSDSTSLPRLPSLKILGQF